MFEFLKLFVYFSLDVMPLGKEHLPFSDIIDGLIIVGNEISFNKRAVSHEKTFPLAFGIVFIVCVRQTNNFIIGNSLIGFLNKGLVPMIS